MENRMENRAYAGFFVRLVAYLIDSFIAFVIAGIIKIPFGIVAGVGLKALKANFLFQYSFIDVVGYVSMVGYFILMTYFTHSTLGKMLFRLEVISSDEEWTFVNIIYRETVGRFLSGLMCIGYLAVIISDKRQGFHDMLCDTYVVYKDVVRVVRPAYAAAGAPTVVEDLGVNVSVQNDDLAKSNINETLPDAQPDEESKIVSAFIMPEKDDNQEITQ